MAATALLANGETNSDISQLATTDVMHCIHRYLRVATPTDDDDSEERAWSMIKGIPRTKAETVNNCLAPQLQKWMNVQQFAKDVGITSRAAATQQLHRLLVQLGAIGVNGRSTY
ncbi:hypothetical protein GQ600_15188 [Phytophthora cactorum]|nr:hypothetical protein GQ600_15188 [Phytophthora cactorum]